MISQLIKSILCGSFTVVSVMAVFVNAANAGFWLKDNQTTSFTTEILSLSGSSSTAIAHYNLLTSSHNQPQIHLITNGSNRYYLVSDSSGRGLGRGIPLNQGSQKGYKLVSPNSRIFPGLVGLRELSEHEINDLN